MDLQVRADQLAMLIEERLGVRGTGLEAKFARVRRRLPRPIRRELAYLLESQRHMEIPKLARQIDWPRLESGTARVERYLRSIDATERRKDLAINWGAGLAFNLLLVGVLLLALVLWRGLV